MACQRKLCNHIVFSESVEFSDPNLLINIPSGAYENGEKYCIVIAQSIPTDTTISATVGITIGEDTTIYPLVNSNCTNVNATEISSRTVYPTRVYTNIQDGVFKLLGNLGCGCGAAPSLPIETTAAQSTTGGETD